MSAPLPPPLHRSVTRLGSAVVRITCPDCDRELASATYGARALLELHEPTCTSRRVAVACTATDEVEAPPAD
jgi:hypothetical protein